MTSRHRFSCLFKQYGYQDLTCLILLKLANLYYTPLHRNTEIYIFRKKTHTMRNFLRFHKTTRKITSTLWAPSSHIFYSIKSCRPFMTFGTSPKHRSICINIFSRNALSCATLFAISILNRRFCSTGISFWSGITRFLHH